MAYSVKQEKGVHAFHRMYRERMRGNCLSLLAFSSKHVISSCCGVLPTNRSNSANILLSISAGAEPDSRSTSGSTSCSPYSSCFPFLRLDNSVSEDHQPVAVFQASGSHLVRRFCKNADRNAPRFQPLHCARLSAQHRDVMAGVNISYVPFAGLSSARKAVVKRTPP